jgi:hypothetical protein
MLVRLPSVRVVAQQPAPQRGSEPAPRVSRRALGLAGGAALLLGRSGAAEASFSDDAREKARAKAALLEATRAKAEGRAPAAAPPPKTAAAAPAGKAAKAEAPAPKREAPLKAKLVEEVRRSLALCATPRARGLR